MPHVTPIDGDGGVSGQVWWVDRDAVVVVGRGGAVRVGVRLAAGVGAEVGEVIRELCRAAGTA